MLGTNFEDRFFSYVEELISVLYDIRDELHTLTDHFHDPESDEDLIEL